MKKEYASLVLAAMLTLGGTGLANAMVVPEYNTAISYIANNVADVTEGEDLWQYTYTVSGDSFNWGAKGFTIVFDGDKTVLPTYSSLPTPNSDWDVYTFEGEAGDVLYDVQSLVEYPTLADQFSVTFVWLGGTEVPGSQAFYVYDQGLVPQQYGMTAPVPVPGTVMLLGSALAALSAVGRRKKN